MLLYEAVSDEIAKGAADRGAKESVSDKVSMDFEWQKTRPLTIMTRE